MTNRLIFSVLLSVAVLLPLFDAVIQLDNLNQAVDIGRTKFAESPYQIEATLNTLEIIRLYGYIAETHLVRTQDGYLLELNRIPCNKNCSNDGSHIQRQPVLLLHGLFNSGVVWVLNGPDKSFAFLLAEAGYDVWIGNYRGSVYGNGHDRLSTNPRSPYWLFSWHEMGVYDNAAKIDYIYEQKLREGYSNHMNNSLIMVGHSMGTTTGFVLFSERPEYNEKVRAFLALAPIAYMTHIRSPLRYLSAFSLHADSIFWLFGGSEFAPQYPLTQAFTRARCSLTELRRELCMNEVFVFLGFDYAQFNTSVIPLVTGHFPAGTSTMTVAHYGQVIKSGGRFRQYNHGPRENLRRYGQMEPPRYNLGKIVVPTLLAYGDGDFVTNVRDVERIDREIKNSIGIFRVDFPNFDHIDFVFATDVVPLVYQPLLEVMANYR